MSERVHKILNRLPTWWSKEKDSQTEHLIKSFSEEFDSNFIEINNLHTEVYVETSSGKRLDELGKIFKLSRKPNETDSQFRTRIKAFWPGFSGGGTIPAIKSTVSKMTGIPEEDVSVIETTPHNLKFRASIDINEEGDDLLIPTMRDVVWNIKAAGIYPFFKWNFCGDLTTESLAVEDSVSVQYITQLVWFSWEASLIDGGNVLW